MTPSDKIQFAALLVAILTFALTQLGRLLQRSRQDNRSNVKLRIFEILGGDSRKLGDIADAYRKAHGKVSTDELRKAIYEMLVDNTAYYEWTGTYRARWRNPKKKDGRPPVSNQPSGA